MVRIPHSLRARTTAVLSTGCLLLACATWPAAGAGDDGSGGDLHTQKHRVQAKITGAHTDLDESSAQLRSATAALLTARGQLGAARSSLAATRGRLAAATVLDEQMRDKLAAAVSRLEQAQDELSAGRRRIVAERDTLGQVVVANYQSGDPSLMGLSMVLTSQDPTELTGQLSSVQSVMDKESVVLSRLEASRALLSVQEGEVAAARRRVAGERTAAAENLERRRVLESQAEDAEASVTRLVLARSHARHTAEDATDADLAQLATLRRERDRIAAVLKRRADRARARAAAAAAAADHVGVSGGGPVRSSGFLDYPVSGPVTSPFGWRIHPIYGYRSLHDGIDFGAACGTPIRAAAAGTVLERYFQTAWGNRVIIDHGYHHGAGLATITNHMNGPAIVAPGQHVRRGQVVGYVGTTGWSTGCHLHFTVLQNGTAVDPASWF